MSVPGPDALLIAPLPDYGEVSGLRLKNESLDGKSEEIVLLRISLAITVKLPANYQVHQFNALLAGSPETQLELWVLHQFNSLLAEARKQLEFWVLHRKHSKRMLIFPMVFHFFNSCIFFQACKTTDIYDRWRGQLQTRALCRSRLPSGLRCVCGLQ